MKRQLACILVLLIALFAGNAAAISVSPPRVELQDIPKDFAVERSVVLAGISPGSIIRVSKAGEAEQWISLPLGEEFDFPDTENLEFPFTITVPKEAPNGAYEARIHIVADASEKAQQANSAAVSSGVFIDISFTVSGKEVKQYSINGIRIPETEVGSPLPIIVEIKNHGNVLAKPSRVDLTIKDKKKKNVLFSESNTEVSPVEPFSLGESIATFHINLNPELYFADVNVHKDSEIMSEENIPFEILVAGSLESSGELLSLSVQDKVTEIAKVEASFKNTGSIGFYGMLEGEVYRDGNLVDTFLSDQVFFKKGAPNDFVVFYNVKGEGHYIVKAHALFLDKKSNSKEITFSVVPKETEIPTIPILIGVIAVLALYIIFNHIRKNIEKKKQTEELAAMTGVSINHSKSNKVPINPIKAVLHKKISSKVTGHQQTKVASKAAGHSKHGKIITHSKHNTVVHPKPHATTSSKQNTVASKNIAHSGSPKATTHSKNKIASYPKQNRVFGKIASHFRPNRVSSTHSKQSKTDNRVLGHSRQHRVDSAQDKIDNRVAYHQNQSKSNKKIK